MQQRNKTVTEDFYIKQLLRIGIYKISDKQLYELSKDELQNEYLVHYVDNSLPKVFKTTDINEERYV
ncbi:Fur-regulated basic protein FbpA [Bacillus salacetis]|uniref:Fur-regulated basic protein FbpA n=1 Tax=Bacillus salacetis TaxID=2315464 RepID=A0A3A1QTR5_9BACI|nr:Fur-regulated basic protein FbpA [Bacillus salacetis]RIW30882.1 Fur-regulated basic protein FbpA [Bacillus salacetis]